MKKYLFQVILASVIGFSFLNQKAEANFSPLLDPKQIANFSEICYDASSIANIIMLFQTKMTVFAASSPGGQVSSALFSLAQYAQGFQDVCRLVIAIGTAKDTNGILRAAKVANSLTNRSLETYIDLYEDTTSFNDFLTGLKDDGGKGSRKQKLLNVANYNRALNFAFKWLPLDGIDANRVAQKKSKQLARAAMLDDMTNTIFGCRVPVVQLDKDSVRTPDGQVKSSEIQRNTVRQQRASLALNKSSAALPKIVTSLQGMIAEVSNTPEELRGALAVLNRFVREGTFVSVGYVPPASGSKLTNGEIGIRENKYAALQPEENPEQGIIPLKKRPKTEQVEDGSGVFYENKGTVDFAQCSKQQTTQSEKWLFLNPDIIADRFIKGEWIADSVRVCPAGERASLTNMKISSLSVTRDEELINRAVERAGKTLEDNCKAEDTNQILKDFQGTNSFRNENSGTNFYAPPNKCRTTESDLDNLTPLDGGSLATEIDTMADYMEYYNRAFSSFIKAEYSLALSENPISQGLNRSQRSLSGAMRSSDGSYGSQSRWQRNSGNEVSSEQMRFVNKWRNVSLCQLPSYLIRKYPDAKQLVEEPSTSPEEFAGLIRKCQLDERKVENNDQIFEDFFFALVDELFSLQNAKAEILAIDLRMGAFKPNAPQKPLGCYENSTAADITMAAAKTQILAVETMTELNEKIEELVELNIEQKRKNEEEAKRIEEVQMINLGKFRESRLRREVDSQDVLSNPNFNYGTIAPPVESSKSRDQKYGIEMFE